MQFTRRLHITPLNPQLLPLILPEAIQTQASNISFHTIQTFPEKGYGYIELPAKEGDKLRRKLNGCFLKGQKMKVEEARPRGRASNELPQSEKKASSAKEPRTKKPQVDGKVVLPAIELPKDRKVKRGWKGKDDTGEIGPQKKKDNKGKGKNTKGSSLHGEDECLFKTRLPVNATSQDTSEKVRKRKRGKEDRDVVVREFKRTTRHAGWLRDTDTAQTEPTKEYVEGKGWINEAGDVVEKSKKAKKSTESCGGSKQRSEETVTINQTRKAAKIIPSAVKSEEDSDADETSTSGSSDSDSDSGSHSEDRSKSSKVDSHDQEMKEKPRAEGLGISSVEDGLEGAEVERLSISRSSGSPIPHVETQPTSAPSIEVHPLEALFKRPSAAASQSQTPKKPHLEVSTSFNFFDPDTADTGSTLLPQTPFTQQDIRYRRQRSAAPTPDTAAPGKSFGNVWGGDSVDADDVESDGEEEQNEAVSAAGLDVGEMEKMKREKTESEFEKWFWEHRGENNRAWKRRRREAAKEKRAKNKRQRKV